MEEPRRAALVLRFALQKEAIRALGPTEMGGRLSRCLKNPHGGSEGPVLWRSASKGTASLAGLEVCGSVWMCPCCAAKVSERRRVELARGLHLWKEAGGSVALLTLTVPHQVHHDLRKLLDRFLRAIRAMLAHRNWKELREEVGLVGTVRALEVTHGEEHGWHPHCHVLLFLKKPVDLVWFQREVYALWLRETRRVKLGDPHPVYGVDVRDGSNAGAYVAKFGREVDTPSVPDGWGLDAELCKAHLKKGKSGSRSPWDLLRSSLYDDDGRARALFAEYAAVFKGKRQLTYSRGLRARLGLSKDATDEELASAAENDDSTPFYSLTRDEWERVVSCGVRGRLLLIACDGDLDELRRFLDRLPPVRWADRWMRRGKEAA